jgi:hypothetical protein
MSRHDIERDFNVDAEALTEGGVLYRLLDPAFGFFVWAIYFLLVYCTTAVLCAQGVRPVGDSIWWPGAYFAVAATLVALAVVLGHALLTWRKHRQRSERFLMWITVAHDGVAAVAIAWMLFPLLLVPACS